MNISCMYWDNKIAICIKPAGVLSEAGGMPELLKEQLGGEIYPVHRLDRAVGGLMVYARDREAAARLSSLMSGGGFNKEYLAVTGGCPEKEEDCLRDLLFKDSRSNKSYVVKRPRKGVREARLSYRLLERGDGLSLLRVKLQTGRSHQIRVQFASRGLPLAGDGRYGSPYKNCGIALWSCSLSFVNPFTGQSMSFSALPPRSFPWSEFEYLKNKENLS